MQSNLAFPQSLSEKYRPQTIAEFVGLEKPKKILGKFAAKPYASAWLFVRDALMTLEVELMAA
jgi:DNA polymerase III gamma/tau subunit